MRRVSVVGISGSGKSTLATAIAGRLGVPWLELDSVFHMRDWTPRPIPEFRAEVDRFTSGEGWVVDGNYSAVRDLVWERADTVIWIDLPRHLVMRRLLSRTLRRMATGAELWNGNKESFRFLLDKDESIIRYAWTAYGPLRDRFERAAADPANAHLTFVRLTSRAAVDRLTELPRGGRDGTNDDRRLR
ncbi:hypothetical protein [Streptosporangium lutulentum]|uniref:Adenylate kinase family enzyme n=1 Tax=Streptosporangium lutulentum TaxID=1461250 RepID=A0ABT9Q937_9ACTN|nr:hypothetical protein [Streptosporangium lutulentum]MDP9842838.1 adenylate kinase family enzyme [Streptosporangium lutulentum]